MSAGIPSGDKKMPIINWYKKALSNLDRTIAIILSIIAIIFVIYVLSKGHYSTIPIIILFSSTAYLLLRDKKSFHENLPEILVSNRLSVFTHIIFFLSVSLLLWFSWSNLYYRSPLYFVVVLIAAASIIMNIFCLNNTKSFNVVIILIKITILSYIIYAGVYYQFEGIYGTDPWLHDGWIQETINIGHLSENPSFLNSYYLFPIFHLNGAITSIITNLSSYSSVFVSCGLLMAMSGVFALIISRKMINSKAALLVALIVPLTSTNIEKSTELIPMSLGYIFFLLIMCFVFCSAEKSPKYRLLIIFLSIVLILTHTIAAFTTLLIFIAFFVGIKFYYAIMKTNESSTIISAVFLCAFVTTMITRWMQQPPEHASFFEWTLHKLIDSLQMDYQFVFDKPIPISNISNKIFLFEQSGYFLLLAFAIIGALIYLHIQISTSNRIGLVFVTGGIFTTIYLFSLSSLDNILPYRWFLFFYLPLSILAVTGLLWVSNLIKSNTRRLAIIMLVILAIIFSMTTNGIGNKDNPLFFNNAARYGYTQSEFAAIHTLSDVKAGRFVTDIYFSIIFPYVLTDDEYNEMMQRSNKNIFIQRNYYLKNPEWNNKYRVSIVTGDLFNIIADNVFVLNFMKEKYMINIAPMIYNNGNVKVYILSSKFLSA